MERNEQELIDELFGHLAEVERGSGPRDTEAERYINQLIARQPQAAYFMTQSLIVQERALQAAQERIEELEREAEARSGGGRGSFLGGLFGGGSGGASSRTSVPSTGSVPQSGGGFSYPGQGAPMDRGAGRAPEPARYPEPERGSSGGGSFLGGVMQTAAGVAGGVVLGNMITGMLGGHGHGAQAASSPWGASSSGSQEASHHAMPEPEPQTVAQEEHHLGFDDASGSGDFGGDFDIDI